MRLPFSEGETQRAGPRQAVGRLRATLSVVVRAFTTIRADAAQLETRSLLAPDFESEPRRPTGNNTEVRKAAGFALDGVSSGRRTNSTRVACALVVATLVLMLTTAARADVVAPEVLTSEEAGEEVVSGGCTPYANNDSATDPHFAFPVNLLMCHHGGLGDATYVYDGQAYRRSAMAAHNEPSTDTSATSPSDAALSTAPAVSMDASRDDTPVAPPDAPVVASLRAAGAFLSAEQQSLERIVLAAAALLVALTLARMLLRNASQRRADGIRERLAHERLRTEHELRSQAERNRAEQERRLFDAAQQKDRDERERAARAASIDGAVDNLEAQVAALINSICAPSEPAPATVVPCVGCGTRCKFSGRVSPGARGRCPRCETVFPIGGTHAAAG